MVFVLIVFSLTLPKGRVRQISREASEWCGILNSCVAVKRMFGAVGAAPFAKASFEREVPTQFGSSYWKAVHS
eukprot:1180154-Prorocentrum_minimum.AAC.2